MKTYRKFYKKKIAKPFTFQLNSLKKLLGTGRVGSVVFHPLWHGANHSRPPSRVA